MAFKTPLESGDSFVSKLAVKKDRFKYMFYQNIYRLPDMKLVLRSEVTTVTLVNGELKECPQLDEILGNG